MIWKIGLTLILSACFWWGGKRWHNARRFIMPIILSIFCAWGRAWWLFPAICVPMAGMLTLGYGDKSPLRRIFGDGWGRGVWGLLVALAASLGLFIGGFLPIYWFIGYLALNFTLENALKKLPQDIGDPLIGLGFASLVFLI